MGLWCILGQSVAADAVDPWQCAISASIAAKEFFPILLASIMWGEA